MFNIGDKLTKENYTQGAVWCNENNAIINPNTWCIEAVLEPLPLTYEEIRQIRASLYAAEVDPITAHINRLRDENQTDDVIIKIDRLLIERKGKVEEIKTNNPYPQKEE